MLAKRSGFRKCNAVSAFLLWRGLQRHTRNELALISRQRGGVQPSVHYAAISSESEHRGCKQPALPPPVRRNNNASIPLPPPRARENPDAWVAVLEPFIPPPRSQPGSAFLEHAYSVIPQVLLEARKQANLDLLFYLGVSCQRWATFMWIAKILVDIRRPPGFFGIDLKSLERQAWFHNIILDETTAEDQTALKKRVPMASYVDSADSVTGVGQGWHLDEFVDWKQALDVDRTIEPMRNMLGQVWQTLGNMMLVASSLPPDEADAVLQKALSVLARLHHRGYIPDDVYKHTLDEDASFSQPPLLHDLSLHIFSNLSSAAFDNDLNAWEDFTDEAIHSGQENAKNPSLWSNFQEVRIAPGVWLELILWCCLHGGWLKEGASILGEMRKLIGDRRWSLMCWRSIESSLESDWSKILEGRLVFQSREHKPWPSERVITAEVVVAYVDGLASAVSNARDGYGVQEVLEKIHMLKTLLERDRMSLGRMTWDAVISRFAELPEFSIESNPRLMESALDLAETYGRETESANAPQLDNRDKKASAYYLGGTAATLGLHHRTLMSYIQNRDSGAALRLLAHLQSLTDKNKRKALEDFFKLLKSKRADQMAQRKGSRRATRENPQFPRAGYPAFFPAIPVEILAALFDLLTETGAIEIGRWMVYSQDVDGPLVTTDLYAHQTLAPALIRFAAATEDESLLLNLSRAQSASISGRTLIALCEARTRQEKWEDAAKVLRLMRKYSLHEWDIEDHAKLIKALFPFLKDLKDSNSSRSAADFLQRLLRGDLGQVWGPDFSQLDTAVGIICSLSPDLAELCSNLLDHGHIAKVAMPTDSFNQILQGVVTTFGSVAGKILWEIWCEQPERLRRIEIPCQDSYKVTRRSISPLFCRQDDQSLEEVNPNLKVASFSGAVEPEVKTLRIIAGSALQEAKAVSGSGSDIPSDPNNSTTVDSYAAGTPSDASSVLSWAATVFRNRFNLRSVDIEYELGGFPSGQHDQSPLRPPLYSAVTLKSWHALASTPSCKLWALAEEEQLRNFAVGSQGRQMTFEPTLSAERKFLHCLAADLGMTSESFGDEPVRQVTVSKTTDMPEVPSLRIHELAGNDGIGFKGTDDT